MSEGRVKRKAALAAANFALEVNSASLANPLELVACDQLDPDELPFRVVVNVDCLILMDIHAHVLANEVIGFLGGDYCVVTKTLYISAAEPCQSLQNNHYQCEMDPVMQSSAYERLQARNFKIVGWYHSHPTFVPNPSNRDIETQLNWQNTFGDQPFVGFIVSPFLRHGSKGLSNLAELSDDPNRYCNPRRLYAGDKIYDCDVMLKPFSRQLNRALASDRKFFWVRREKKNHMIAYEIECDLHRECDMIASLANRVQALCEWMVQDTKATMKRLDASLSRSLLHNQANLTYLDKILGSLMHIVLEEPAVCSYEEAKRIMQDCHAILRDELMIISKQRSQLQTY